MNDIVTAVVRFLHVISGVMMAGGVLLWSTVIMPGVEKALPGAVRGPFLQVFFPRVSRYLTAASLAAIVTGMWLMGLIVGFDGIIPVVRGTPYGAILAVSAVLVLLVLAIALLGIQPAGKRLLDLASTAREDAAPPPEVTRLRKRLAVLGVLNVLLTVTIIALMAWAVDYRT